MTETFTRDSDGAKFEEHAKGYDSCVLVKPVDPPLKTIDWDVVVELGLLCEFFNSSVAGNNRANHITTLKSFSEEGFKDRNGLHRETCRILPDQVAACDKSITILLDEAGIRADLYGYAANKYTLLNIRPRDGYTYEVQK